MEYTVLHLNEITDECYKRWFFEMSPQRQEKCRRIRKIDGKKACIAADHLTRTELAKILKCAKNEIRVLLTEDGKPVLPGDPVWFSLSHSEKSVVFCHANTPVGIDIETIRPIFPATAKRICTENELHYLEDAKNEEEYLLRFFILWTRKEAMFKVHGKKPRKDTETETLLPPSDWEVESIILGNTVISLAKKTKK